MFVKKEVWRLSHICGRPLKISRTSVSHGYIKPHLFQSAVLNMNIFGSKLEGFFLKVGGKK